MAAVESLAHSTDLEHDLTSIRSSVEDVFLRVADNAFVNCDVHLCGESLLVFPHGMTIFTDDDSQGTKFLGYFLIGGLVGALIGSSIEQAVADFNSRAPALNKRLLEQRRVGRGYHNRPLARSADQNLTPHDLQRVYGRGVRVPARVATPVAVGNVWTAFSVPTDSIDDSPERSILTFLAPRSSGGWNAPEPIEFTLFFGRNTGARSAFESWYRDCCAPSDELALHARRTAMGRFLDFVQDSDMPDMNGPPAGATAFPLTGASPTALFDSLLEERPGTLPDTDGLDGPGDVIDSHFRILATYSIDEIEIILRRMRERAPKMFSGLAAKLWAATKKDRKNQLQTWLLLWSFPLIVLLAIGDDSLFTAVWIVLAIGAAITAVFIRRLRVDLTAEVKPERVLDYASEVWGNYRI